MSRSQNIDRRMVPTVTTAMQMAARGVVPGIVVDSDLRMNEFWNEIKHQTEVHGGFVDASQEGEKMIRVMQHVASGGSIRLVQLP